MNLAPNPFLHANYPFPSPAKPPIRGLWLLCFHGLTNCFSRNPFRLMNICVAPGVWGPHFIPNSRSQVHLRQHVYSQWLTASWILLPLFFEFPFFVFSNLRTLLAKYRGWGYPSPIPQDSAVQIPAIKISTSSLPSPNPLDVPTFRHSDKIQPTSL